MVRSMRLFLIRHGETVDNVAQLYAGSRDSALTNHGYQQATRLGLHFKALGIVFTHLYSSYLQRAAKTAGLIREAQLSPRDDVSSPRAVPEVMQLRILMEQDFGDLEGKKWSKMQTELHNKPGFAAMETKEAMGRRADTFLDEHLQPLLDGPDDAPDPVVAVVSHGIFLSTLWKRLLRRLQAKSILLSHDLQKTARFSLEHLGGWSNTGYLDLHMTRNKVERSSLIADAALSKPDMIQPIESKPSDTIGAVEAPHTPPKEVTTGKATAVGVTTLAVSAPSARTTLRTSCVRMARGWTTLILAINGKDHLKSLKRTRGGVGSSRHDASQKGIESFFKRHKVG